MEETQKPQSTQRPQRTVKEQQRLFFGSLLFFCRWHQGLSVWSVAFMESAPRGWLFGEKSETSASPEQVFVVMRGLTSARPDSLRSFSPMGAPTVSTRLPRITIRARRHGLSTANRVAVDASAFSGRHANLDQLEPCLSVLIVEIRMIPPA